ncbi:MAG: MarR family winged helix-turn-helix transcriptional regulator [Flavobacteriales bacterium]
MSENCKLPYGKLFNSLAKSYFGNVAKKLAVLDIDRCFYPLHLIIEANGKLTQNELSELIGADKASTTRHVDYLVKMNYVKREPNPQDRREFILKTTPKADEVATIVCKAFDEMNDAINKTLTTHSPDEFCTLLKGLNNKLKPHRTTDL